MFCGRDRIFYYAFLTKAFSKGLDQGICTGSVESSQPIVAHLCNEHPNLCAGSFVLAKNSQYFSEHWNELG